jgi:hypothetical protein
MRDARRKRVWVDQFQTKLVWRIALYWLIYALSLFSLLFAWRLISGEGGEVWQQLVATASENVPLFLAFFLAVPWSVLDAVRFTNRLVGPLARFQEGIQHVTVNAPVQPVQLRRGDFLVEMEDDFNAMLTALQQRGAVELRADGSGRK